MSRTKVLADPRLFWALGGPLLLGALPGLRFGLGPTLRLGPSFLLALLATVAVMGPALYLLWGLTGARGTLQQVRGAFADDRFFTTRADRGGTGLGLPIAAAA